MNFSFGLNRKILTAFINNLRNLFTIVILSSTAFFSAQKLALAADNNPIVQTRYGPVRGFTRNMVQEFLGIPYAAPPMGALRWRPPQPPVSWRQPLNALNFGNSCPQNDKQVVFATPSDAENCLNLNVFTKSIDKKNRSKLPVMVWIFGGNFLNGTARDYNASKLVTQGNVVVVTINYRLGILGWFAQRSLDEEGHQFGNYGLLDQQFALKWVRKNIASFGGNPNNITIFGQSSGGRSVYSNMMSPQAKGLFQRAISESGAMFPLATMPEALKKGTGFAAAVGCGDQKSACLRSLPVSVILKMQKPYLTGLVLDGSIIPLQPADALGTGRFNRVPIITGSNRDEGSFFVAIREVLSGHPLTAEEYPKALTDVLSMRVGRIVNPSKALATYPLADYSSPSSAYIAAISDLSGCLARQQDRWLSKYVPVYSYEFNYRDAPSYFPKVSFPMGAYHTAELQFIFPLFHGENGTPRPLNVAQQKLSSRIINSWTTFAKAGRLTKPWQLYNSSQDNYLVLNVGKPKVLTGSMFALEHKCNFWDGDLSK
jgi:para-nitrobenzyl esterase